MRVCIARVFVEKWNMKVSMTKVLMRGLPAGGAWQLFPDNTLAQARSPRAKLIVQLWTLRSSHVWMNQDARSPPISEDRPSEKKISGLTTALASSRYNGRSGVAECCRTTEVAQASGTARDLSTFVCRHALHVSFFR